MKSPTYYLVQGPGGQIKKGGVEIRLRAVTKTLRRSPKIIRIEEKDSSKKLIRVNVFRIKELKIESFT